MQKSKCKRRRQPLSVFAFCILNLALMMAGHPAIAQAPRNAAEAFRQTPAGAVLVSHEFTESAQGWQVAGDTGTVAPEFTAGGGGYITGNDEAIGETWYFRAPMSVLRQLPAAVNGTISFSLKQSGSQVSLFDDDVVIVGPAGRLSYRFQTAPGTDWTDFSVRLLESEGWTWNWNRRATQAQINSVLAAPTGLDIRGEYVTGQDEGSLGRFVLRAPAR